MKKVAAKLRTMNHLWFQIVLFFLFGIWELIRGSALEERNMRLKSGMVKRVNQKRWLPLSGGGRKRRVASSIRDERSNMELKPNLRPSRMELRMCLDSEMRERSFTCLS